MYSNPLEKTFITNTKIPKHPLEKSKIGGNKKLILNIQKKNVLHLIERFTNKSPQILHFIFSESLQTLLNCEFSS